MAKKSRVEIENEKQLDLEKREAFSGPAANVTKVLCTVGPAVRLAFMELDVFGKPHFRSAVSLHFQDAIELRKLLERVLKPMEDALDKEIQKIKQEQREMADGSVSNP